MVKQLPSYFPSHFTCIDVTKLFHSTKRLLETGTLLRGSPCVVRTILYLRISVLV